MSVRGWAKSLVRDRRPWWKREEEDRKALSDKRQEQKGIHLTTSCEGRANPMLWGDGFVSGNAILLPQESLVEVGGRNRATVMIALTSTPRLTGYYGIWHNGIRVSPGGGTIFEELTTGAQTTPWAFLESSTTTEYVESYVMADAAPNYVQTVEHAAGFVANVSVEWRDISDWNPLSSPADYTVAAGVYTITTNSVRGRQVRFRYTASGVPFGGGYALAYHGTSYVAHSALDVGPAGQQATLGDWKFLLAADWAHLPAADRVFPADGGDYLVPVIVKDILTGYAFGQSCGWPVARVDDASWQAWKEMCGAHGLFASLTLTEQREASEILADLLDSTHTAVLCSEGKLKFVPLDHRSATATHGAVTFTYSPDLSPVTALGPSDFMVEGDEDPVSIEFVPEEDVRNAFPVEFLNRGNETTDGEWPPSTVQVEETAHANDNGLRVADVTTCHHFTTEARAKWYSEVLAMRSVHILRRFSFRLTLGLAWLLEPGDLVSLTDARLLDGATARITSIEEADDSGSLDVEAEDVPW